MLAYSSYELAGQRLNLTKMCLHMLAFSPALSLILVCAMQAVWKIAMSTRIMHPNIVACQGIAEHPATKDLLLVAAFLSWAPVHAPNFVIVYLGMQ